VSAPPHRNDAAVSGASSTEVRSRLPQHAVNLNGSAS
jgi:hypothetical protein